MFEIQLVNESGEQLIPKEFSWASLPAPGQKITLRQQGEFEVIDLVFLVDEQVPNVPKYRIVVRPLKSSSRPDLGWLGHV